ncbi:MAG: gliding motility-associated C-terminal domain-containing protein [Flavobacteriales bacterium]|nr:gliding motility-associated C-terminal domain-containing protein [Flavobacteriales bacterium]
MRSSGVRVLLVLVLLLGSMAARAVVLDPPSLRCASVDPAGDVTLTWVIPPDPNGDFDHYDIFHANAVGGPFTLIGAVAPYAQTTWLHAGAGAGSGPQYYYMVTVSSGAPPNSSLPSDTLSTLYLQVNQSTPIGNAVLSWTAQHLPPLSTAAAMYDIWMEYPIGTWQVVGQTINTNLSFSYPISICEDSLTFRVSLTNDQGCSSFSNLDGDEFVDATPPSSPIVVTASVDTATGLATITWLPSPEGDTDAYIIVLTTPGGNIIIDTVWGQFTNTYIWLLSNAANGAESFTVAAFDTCWTGSPPSPNTSATLASHRTIYTSTTHDKCAGEVTVSWTPYVGWPVQTYEVHARMGTGAWFQLGTFGPTVTSALHSGVPPSTLCCYVVKAIREDGTFVLSNKACRFTDYPPIPAFNYLATVTVLEKDHILVQDLVDMTAQAKRYRLQRSDNGGPWVEIAQAPGTLGPLVDFNDLDVVTNERSYQYRVVVDDSCGTEALTSNIGTSILLFAEADLTGVNRLRWNGYMQWDGGVAGYNIYRSVQGDPYTLIATNPQDIWNFTDDVGDLITTNGRFCYIVEAVETGNPFGANAYARSNEACAVQELSIFIPNAFIHGGYNNSFKPVLAFADVNGYEFTIFNRWGQSIWTTNDPEEAWKGQVNGNFVPQGVYAYYCAVKDGRGNFIEKRGTVTFIWGQE